jgi:predicted kinase
VTDKRPFVVVSGLPASGKTTLARHLADALDLPLLDKDDILEGLFEHVREVDPPTRRRLSRESDAELARMAAASDGAVIVSFWRHPSQDGASGTPTAWLADLNGRLIEVHCDCLPDVAEQRFRQRRRHPGHNDETRAAELGDQLRRLAAHGPLGLGQVISLRTDSPYRPSDIIDEVRRGLRR